MSVDLPKILFNFDELVYDQIIMLPNYLFKKKNKFEELL